MANLTGLPVYPQGKKPKARKVRFSTHPAAKYGTDKEYLEWVSHQPSCISGDFYHYKDGVGRNIACHVRRVSKGAGVGIKPLYSAVPMTNDQHHISHQHGEHGLLNRTNHEVWDKQSAARWFNEQARLHLERWIKQVNDKGN